MFDPKYLKSVNKETVVYVLKSPYISIDTKIVILNEKINQKTNIKTVREYIEAVEELKKTSLIWENQSPIIENRYQDAIVKILENLGIAKREKSSDDDSEYVALIGK